jgi:hypothetical protein
LAYDFIQKEICMLTMLGGPRRFCDGITRRQTLQAGAVSAISGLTLSNVLRAEASTTPDRPPGKAKSVVVLYLHGGAPTQDMYDMKPLAPIDVRGEFQPIPTSARGIDICEHLPRSAHWMHRAAIVRSVNHRAGCHNNLPSYSGLEEPTTDVTLLRDTYQPSMGSVCEYLKPPGDDLPAYAHLPTPLGWGGGSRRSGPYGGFLGKRYDPLETVCEPYVEPGARIDVRQDPALVKGMPRIGDSRLAEGITLDRLRQRRGLLDQLEVGLRSLEQRSASGQFDRFQEKAFDVLTSHKLAAAFDPAKIDARVKKRYGDTLFGASTFIGKNLVEAGVRFIQVVWDWYNNRISGFQDFGWDTHEWNFQILRKYLPQVDLSFSALLEDLDANGRLDETLVVIMSDFGRTPNVNKTAGRDHWTFCYSVLFAGAGIRGGTVYGASDRNAAWPLDRPVSTADICATIYECLGIDPHLLIADKLGRPVAVALGGEPIRDILES